MSQQTREIAMPPADYQFPPELNPETTRVTTQAAPVQQQVPEPQVQEQQYQEPAQLPVYDDSDNAPINDQEHTDNTPINDQPDTKELAFQQKNFKAMREESRRIQKERDVLEYQLEQMKLQQQESNRPKQEQAPVEDFSFDFNIDDNELVEASHLKKIAKSNQQMRQELNEMKSSYRQATVESQVRMKYPDWDRVVSPDSLAKFAKMEPELAESVRQNKDPYLQLVSIYKMIKGANISQPVADSVDFNDDKRRIEQNNARPRPTASISPNNSSKPLSVASDYAVGRISKEQMQRENKIMNDIIRGPR